MRIALVTTPLVLLATGLAAAGCGGSSNDADAAATTMPAATATDTPAPTQTPAATDTPAASGALDATGGAASVTATEFSFGAQAITAKAGKLKLTLDNQGSAQHEFVLLKTDDAPDSLTVSGGSVSEAASVGEISETDGGQSKSHTFNLKPGHYVFVCNVPGHYANGMRGVLTVR